MFCIHAIRKTRYFTRNRKFSSVFFSEMWINLILGCDSFLVSPTEPNRTKGPQRRANTERRHQTSKIDWKEVINITASVWRSWNKMGHRTGSARRGSQMRYRCRSERNPVNLTVWTEENQSWYSRLPTWSRTPHRPKHNWGVTYCLIYSKPDGKTNRCGFF